MIRKILRGISDFFIRKMSDDWILRRYVAAGIKFGEATEDLYLSGEPKGFKNCFDRWARFEEEHAKRGYRTISSNQFVLQKNRTETLISNLGWKRPFDEKPCFFAEKFRESYPRWQEEGEPASY